MTLVVKDRVRETTTTSGTGSLTLAGAVTGFQTFSTAIGNGNTTYYAISRTGSADWEVGLGTVSAGVLARTTVYASSNSGSLVSLSGGTMDVYCSLPASQTFVLPEEDWTTPALNSGWSSGGGSGRQTVGYYKDPTGRVFLRGSTIGGFVSGGTPFTLAPGYRPTSLEEFTDYGQDISGNEIYCVVGIDTSGNVSMNNNTGYQNRLSLAGLSFLVT